MAELILEEDLEARPAKKARLEPPMTEPPDTPVIDDMDDASIYGTPSNIPAPQAGQGGEAIATKGSAEVSEPTSLEAPSNGIPGLGLLGSFTQDVYYQAPTPEGGYPSVDLEDVEQSEKRAGGVVPEYQSHDLDLGKKVIENRVDVVESVEGGEDMGVVDVLSLPGGRFKDKASFLDLKEGSSGSIIGCNTPEGAGAMLDPGLLQTADVGGDNGNVEWQFDSSDAESSPSSSDDSGSSDGSEANSEDEDDYQLLDPEEQAKILMRGEDGSDDEGGKGILGSQLRTKNEVEGVKVAKPNIDITVEMKIEELGEVDKIVDSFVLVKANVSGEYQVLDSGSLLCSKDRRVIGVVDETLGRVQQPLYSIAFNSASEITEEGIVVGMKIFYVEQHSSYVFTQPLKGMKGSDASNLHDEEIGEDELEFSDDEAEAEHKRRVKLEKQSMRDARNPGGLNRRRGLKPGSAGGPKNRDSGEKQEGSVVATDLDGDDLYTPLVRPTNLHELMGKGETTTVWTPTDRGTPGNRGRAGGRGGRGAWGGRGGRGGEWRGRARGNHNYHQNDPPGKLTDRLYSSPQSPQYGINMTFNNSPQSAATGPSYFPPQQPPQYSVNPQLHQSFQPVYEHQPNYSWPQPPVSPQYPFAFLPSSQSYYPQSPSTTITSPVGTLPPGSFVNPAFVRNQQPGPWTQPMSPPPQQPQGEARMSPEAEAAFRAAQERLDILKELSGVPGGSGRGQIG
ncbi:MAG: hypothetical protein M1840_007751 [Geoglossum simile]|nr:MAG: hypothetical protein M1840_007751 [Geoglossum simile]